MGVIFGTDGVRGVANRELSPELVFEIGLIAGDMLSRSCEGRRPRIVIGRDTRISGPMLESALVAGLLSAGVDAVRLGVLPTPGVAYVTRHSQMDAGVMISASHNPVEDNGIKFFGRDGFKMPDEWEAEVESLLQGNAHRASRPIGADIGTVRDDAQGAQDYVSYLKSTLSGPLAGCKVVLDCANGAASLLAPRLFLELGVETVLLYHRPDGTNINEACGSTHPERLRQAVLEHRAHAGLAFDGDADRLIAVDEQGELLDGDHILYILAAHMAKHGGLRHNTVVSTVMSNFGFHKALQASGMDSLKSKVGDRYVMEEMRKGGYNLGGEQSGHIIMLDYSTTGDGVLSALQLLQVMRQEGKPLSELASPVVKFPQLVVNVQVKNKYKLEGNRRIEALIRQVESAMAGRGRVLVRPSGTEALVRVMAEGPDERELSSYVKGIVEAVKEELEYSVV